MADSKGSDEIKEDDTDTQSEELATASNAEPEHESTSENGLSLPDDNGQNPPDDNGKSPPDDNGKSPPDDNLKNKSKVKNILLKRVLPAAVGGVLAIVAAPFVLGAVGFGAGGIVAGSIAAQMMSAAAVANGGAVAAGSVVAVLQSAGAVGIGATATTGLFAATSTVTAGVVEVGSRIQDLLTKTDDDPGTPPKDQLGPGGGHCMQ